MQQEYIVIDGARENNLKNVSLRIPKRKITIFTGVSGSGKSSIVFDTISAEAQRQLNETFTAFARNFLPKYEKPNVDIIDNLSTAIIVNQKRLGGNSRSTVGTITDINPILRLLFSRIGEPPVMFAMGYTFTEPSDGSIIKEGVAAQRSPSFAFSFNEQGMCPECHGIGRKIVPDLDTLFDKEKSLNEGAIQLGQFSVGGFYWNQFKVSGFFDMDKKLKDFTPEEWDVLLNTKEKVQVEYKGSTFNVNFMGVAEKFKALYIDRDTSTLADSTKASVEKFMKSAVCPECHGARLNKAALACKINGMNIADMTALEVSELIKVLAEIKDPIALPIVEAAIERLEHLETIGLGYISLDRETTTLSGGESQRVKMVRHLSSSLVDVMYIFDEPSVGLHPRDVHRLNTLLHRLRDKGNTVLVVEHDRDVIQTADHIVDVGPKAGSKGGQIVYEGSFEGLLNAPTLTGQHITQALPIKTEPRKPTGKMRVSNANLHNLKNVTVDIPEGVLTVVTGVAGSGKSTLINEVFLEQHPDAVVIDQSALSTSIRSNLATYTGMMDTIRTLFAKANKVKPGLFSFNSEGACPTCEGLGFIYTDLAFLDSVKTPCQMCEGKRFKPDVLELTLNGKAINEVLDMTAPEALDFFKDRKDLRRLLETLIDVGLNYITLGQPLSTLSGGECQRLKLATELHKEGSVYVMDEPTTGLHMADTANLLRIMNRLVDGGNSVIVIEHNLDVIKNADWIIDLGPEAGHNGGEIVFEGTPLQLIESDRSITGQFLREHDGALIR
jgi:excinuclease UvrABC ATPase subunit